LSDGERRVFLITGASSGIGEATARHAAAAGYKVVLAARSAEKLEALAGELGGLAITCDVTEWADQEAMVERTLADCGRLDVAFANAGFGAGRSFKGSTPEHWRSMVLTNVLGTRNVLRACEQLGVSRFVLISTDKAVEPVSVMGATKRLAEQLTVATGHRTGKAYAAVRFGNVLGSSGSVVPLLQRQLDDGLPLTITQPNATRYFMTIAEAVSLILEAGANPVAGEVYVLDMGEPVRIMDLARDLVRLNGIDPDAMTFTVTGLRPGERLHEKLFYDDELAERTDHPGIFRATRQVSKRIEAQIDGYVDELAAAANEYNDQAVRELLLQSPYLSGMSIVEEPVSV